MYITLSLFDNRFSLFGISQQRNHLQTNTQLVNILPNDVKNLTSILSCCIGHKCGYCNDDTKALLLCESHFSLIFQSRALYHQLTSKHSINILCNDVKNLTSILKFCIGRKCVLSNNDMKALFLCELQFSLFFTSRPIKIISGRTNNLLTLTTLMRRT